MALLSGWIAVALIFVTASVPLLQWMRQKRRAAPDSRTVRVHAGLGMATAAAAFGHTLTAVPVLGSSRALGGGMLALVAGGLAFFVIVAHVSILSASMGEATADAKAVNLGSNVASLITFAIRGTVMWKVALPMAAGNVLGGVIGARLAVKGGDRVIRWMVIAVSLALVVKLSVDVIR